MSNQTTSAQDANEAFDLHASLSKVEAEVSSLRENATWQRIRADIYQRFERAFEAVR